MTYTGQRRYKVNSDAWSTTVEGKAVVIDPKSQTYLGLTESATAIWDRLQEELSVAEIERAVCRDFDGDPQAIVQDVRTFLAQLVNRGLIKEVR